jgi:ABC-2 type transport system permease protein
MFLYMILFPSIKEMGQVEFELMPEEFLQFMGMENMSVMGNFTTYFGMIFAIVLIAIAIFAGSFTSGLLYKEEKDRTIEFLYSLEVSRTEIYMSKAFTGFIATFLITLSAVVSTIICGLINGGETFDFKAVLLIGRFSGFVPFIFLGFSLLIVGITAKFRVTMVSSMLVFVTYLIGYLGTLLGDKAIWLAYFSPFELLKPQVESDMGDKELISIAVYFVLFIICAIIGGIAYNRRDFNV